MIPKDISEKYYQAFSRSLLIWQNVFREVNDEGGMEDTIRTFRNGLRIVEDEEVKGLGAGTEELERLFEKLHKNHVHLMPNREAAHQLCRLIEEQIRLLKIEARKKERDPLS